MNNGTPHLRPPKNQNRRGALGQPARKLLGGGGGFQLVCGRPTFALSSALVPQTLSCSVIAGRPKAALLFWFFGDFRCGALLFMVIHVIYTYKNR